MQQSDLVTASVAALPRVQVYIAVHPQHGTLVSYAYHITKQGRQGDKKEGTMYGGFILCTHATDSGLSIKREEGQQYVRGLRTRALRSAHARRPPQTTGGT